MLNRPFQNPAYLGGGGRLDDHVRTIRPLSLELPLGGYRPDVIAVPVNLLLRSEYVLRTANFY